MTTEEMLLQLIEGQKQMTERLDKIENDISEMKEEAHITREAVNHNGEVLENLTDQLTTLNIVDVKY